MLGTGSKILLLWLNRLLLSSVQADRVYADHKALLQRFDQMVTQLQASCDVEAVHSPVNRMPMSEIAFALPSQGCLLQMNQRYHVKEINVTSRKYLGSHISNSSSSVDLYQVLQALVSLREASHFSENGAETFVDMSAVQ